jgi:hypothetical protein
VGTQHWTMIKQLLLSRLPNHVVTMGNFVKILINTFSRPCGGLNT